MSSVITTPTSSASLAAPRSTGTSRWLWLVVAVLLILFVSLAYAVHSVPYFPIDLQASLAVQGLAAPWFHTLMFVVSWPGFPPQVYIFVVIAGIGLYVTRQRREAVFLVVSSVAIASISQGVKLLVDRPRPPASLVHVLIPNLNGGHWSFPAGHVESYVVLFGFMIYVAYAHWRNNLARGLVIVLGVLMIALVGVSRIDSGEHWLTDAAGGYLLGAAFLAVMLAWYRRRTQAEMFREGGPASS
jgi:undecaprenyl-diphosphatase